MEKRGAIRFSTELAADCRSCNRSWTSRLCNISASGCMIVCPDPGLPDGASLRVRLKGLTAIDGTIVWQHRGHAGVRFREPLHSAVMEYLSGGQAAQGLAEVPDTEPGMRGRTSTLRALPLKRSCQPEVRDKHAARA